MIIRAQRVVLPDVIGPRSIHIRDGRIVDVTGYDEVATDDEIVEVDDESVVMPGLVDTHVHINSPGRTEWEGFRSATLAAAAGGVYAYPDGRTAPDTISIQLEYPSKWIATFDATLVPGARGAALELMGTEGRLYIDRGGYTYQGIPPGRRAAPPALVERRNTKSLEQQHVRNFLDCVKSRALPNSDIVSGHRSALASHLGKNAYLQKRRITFNPASERMHTLPVDTAKMKMAPDSIK